MIGIYKITNKINGKCYIGQSIDIERRWREHKRARDENKILYKDIKRYGIKNFEFKILQECQIDELDELEIYYIKKFDTFNNGYNLTLGGQYFKNYKVFELKQVIHNDLILAKKLTVKQWLVYYYLMSICKWNGQDQERHYFIYKNQLNISAASKILSISRPTFYTTMANLEKMEIIVEEDKYYIIRIPIIYAAVDQKTITFLLQYQKFLGVELIRTYVILSRIFQHQELEQWFNKATIISILDHNINDTSYYRQIELYLGFLEYWNLVDFQKEKRKDNTGVHQYYKIKSINRVSDIENFEIETDVQINSKLVEKIKEEILGNN